MCSVKRRRPWCLQRPDSQDSLAQCYHYQSVRHIFPFIRQKMVISFQSFVISSIGCRIECESTESTTFARRNQHQFSNKRRQCEFGHNDTNTTTTTSSKRTNDGHITDQCETINGPRSYHITTEHRGLTKCTTIENYNTNHK